MQRQFYTPAVVLAVSIAWVYGASLVCGVALGQTRDPLPGPEPIAGTLVIVGGGPTPPEILREFVERAGGEQAKLVVIPTASADADRADAAESFVKQWQAYKPASLRLLHTRDRKQADDPAFTATLTEATGVWLSGGDQAKLIAAYRDTRVHEQLRQLLQRGGVVGGTSAGAAAMADPAILGGRVPAVQTGPGMGLLPGFLIEQHAFKRDRVNRLLHLLHPKSDRVGLAIDESTAVVVRGRTLKVVGQSYVAVVLAASAHKPASVEILKAGDTADIVQLRRAAAARTRDLFPAQAPRQPVVPAGTLFIGGGGGMPAVGWKRFIEAAGGPDAPIVVIPTALEDPLPKTLGEVLALRKAGANNLTVLHTRDRKQADDPAFAEPLKSAKGVWFSGGRQWRFVDAYEGTLTEKLIHEVLAKGGAIGGSSAGASIQAEYMPRGHPLGNSVMMAEGYERGFGLLPGVAIDQHFFARNRTQDMTELMQVYPHLLGIGIDEGTLLVVKGSVMEVVGASKVAVYDRRNPSPPTGPDYLELPAGSTYDLLKRKRLN